LLNKSDHRQYTEVRMHSLITRTPLVLLLLCCAIWATDAQTGNSTRELVALLASKVKQTDREKIVKELGKRGEGVMPEVLKAVEAGTDIERYYELFEELGPKAIAALPLLAKRLGDKKQVLGAAITMMRIKKDALTTLPDDVQRKAAAACYDAIVDPKSDEMDSWCGVVLANLGKPSAPTFVRLLRDKSPKIRSLALESLDQARFSDLEIEGQLILMAQREENPHARMMAIRALGKFGEPNPNAKATLMALLRDAAPYLADATDAKKKKEWNVRRELAESAAESLGRYGAPLVDELVPLLTPMEAPTRIPAITALRSIGEPAVPRLVELLAHKDHAIAISASVALNKIGDSAVPALAKALSTANEQVINHAANALWWIGRPGKSAAPNLLEIVGSPWHSELSRLAAARAALKVDPAVSRNSKAILASIPMLIGIMEKGKPEHQIWAAETLGGIGAAAREALPILRRQTESWAAKTAIEAIEADLAGKK
jgi:HEAT repeat protein